MLNTVLTQLLLGQLLLTVNVVVFCCGVRASFCDDIKFSFLYFYFFIYVYMRDTFLLCIGVYQMLVFS